ncbi:MAG TPA: hypothetical protein VGO21_03550 [Candidatus Paceibacterota bacterium]|nr:hypothetical protein [Candidatus Paceibacterota bacterium]
MTILYILLVIIAYYIYKIYRQKENEKEIIANEKSDAEYEQNRKERFKDYPHLFEKIDDSWIQVFASQIYDGKSYLLKSMFYLMVGESVKIDYSEGSMKYDFLWNATKELLEHLEKFHEGSVVEHEIALATYWQIAATKMGELVKENPNTGSLKSGAHTSEVAGEKLEVAPFTDIENIASLFPKKANHPTHEITFFNKDGSFPRESKGSALIDEKIKALGL